MKHLKLSVISFVALMMVSVTGMAHQVNHTQSSHCHTYRATSVVTPSVTVSKRAGNLSVNHCKVHAKRVMGAIVTPFRIRSSGGNRVVGKRVAYTATVSCASPNRPRITVSGPSRKWAKIYANRMRSSFQTHR